MIMYGMQINLDDALFKEERLKGARIYVRLRWIFVLIISLLLLFQHLLGHSDVSRHSMVFLFFYALFNLFLWVVLSRNYDHRYLWFLAATLDVAFISNHIFGMTVSNDHLAATSAASVFFIPVFFLLHTFRLDRGLLVYLIAISLVGFNFPYFYQYFQTPDLYHTSLSISPLSHGFKSVYITFIGLLCIYLQYSLFRFIGKQLDEARAKAKLDVEIKVEQQKNLLNSQLIEQERVLNKELEAEIRKKDEYARKLKETQGLINTLMSNLVGAVSRCLNDAHFTAIYYGEKIYNITGYAASDFIDNKNVSFASIILPEDMEMVRDQIKEAVDGRTHYSIEFRIRHKNGNIVWVNENGQPVYDDEGNLLYLDGITTDITERKNTEQSFRDLTDFLPQTVYETDSRGYLVFSNRAAHEFFGKGVPDATGRVHVAQFFAPEYREVIWKNIERPPKLENGKRLMAEAIAIKKDGSLCPVLIYSTSVVRDGRLTGERGIIVDISEIKSTEEELKKAKGELERLNNELEQTIMERTSQLTEVNTQLLRVQKENLQSQFEVLKQQVNPHFLFNSLNVLTSLIKVDPDLAESFTERLSKVYRYVLENKDKDLVTLGTEMDFLKAYVFLLDIRFSNKVFVKIDLDDNLTDAYVVPLALQLLIENAIKHNTFSKKSPLLVNMFIDDEGFLNIINNLQSRETQMVSTGIGLVNIAKRYSLLSERQPVFEMTEESFIAKIPLIMK